ncbi:putative hydrogenase nickel insertion protein HypA [Umbribacter vaginalis]|jgi:hypothetical protein|nr:putative hydrogenase nickel insertion protein HypA [Coriobacteriales bacterium DNF00809]
MHEMGIMEGVLDSALKSAQQAHALRIRKITLSIGDMTECIDDALQFSFEILSENTLAQGATLVLNKVSPRSVCLDCRKEFDHDRFHRQCPYCQSYSTDLIAGRELSIDSIEVDLPDDNKGVSEGNVASDGGGTKTAHSESDS